MVLVQLLLPVAKAEEEAVKQRERSVGEPPCW
jgi:hypothetical protein